jgi:hypothetical protein
MRTFHDVAHPAAVVDEAVGELQLAAAVALRVLPVPTAVQRNDTVAEDNSE